MAVEFKTQVAVNGSGDSLFQKYTDANYGTGWNKNYFEFRDCGRRRGAKKYWSREKDADQWFELGCVPE